MELLLLVPLIALAAFGGAARYVHWRGPTVGTMDEVTGDHMKLFTPPPSDDEEDES